MSRHVPDEKLELMWLKVSGEVRSKRRVDCHGKPRRLQLVIDGVSIDAIDLANLLEELRLRRRTTERGRNFQLGSTTKLLMKMKVGDVVVVDPIPNSRLSFSRRTARHKMQQEDAVWQSKHLENGKLQITRKANGISPYDREENLDVLAMSQMKVGEYRTMKACTSGMKIRARKVMGNISAKWSYIHLVTGDIRCKREV